MSLQSLVVEDILEAFPAHNKTDGRFSMFGRPVCGIAIATRGCYQYTMEGEAFASDPTHAIYLPQGGVYQLHCLEEDESLLINFRCTVCPPRLQSFPIENPAPLARCYENIREHLAYPPWRAYCLSELYHLIHLLSMQQEPAIHDPIIARSVRYIEENLANRELSGEFLAAIAHISPVTYRKNFTRALGIPPMRYIIRRRMEYAKQLLRDGTLSVGQTAEQCGFSNIYYFSNAFKTHTGLTPTQFAALNTAI